MGALAKMIGLQKDSDIKERMEFLHVAAKAKLAQYKEKLNENFINPESIAKAQIPGERSIRYYEQYHVASSQTVGKDMKEHLDQVLDAFFSIGDPGGSTKKAVKTGVKSLISMGFDAFIGSTQAGETETIQYYVIPENNAFVRVDIACWKYKFSSKKFLGQHDTGIAYIFCKSVVDHKKLSLDELIYLVTESMIERGIIDPEYVLLAQKDFDPTPPVDPGLEPADHASKEHEGWQEKKDKYDVEKTKFDEFSTADPYTSWDPDKKRATRATMSAITKLDLARPAMRPFPTLQTSRLISTS